MPAILSTPCTPPRKTQTPYSMPLSASGRKPSSAASPRVVTPKQALAMHISPKASEDVPDNAISFPSLMEYVQRTYWEETGLWEGWRDIKLYTHLKNAYPEIMVVSDDNALLVEEGGHITLYSPSMVMEALACTEASCMLFIRSKSKVQYKGTYKASHVEVAKRARYHAFSAEQSARIIDMTVRVVGGDADEVAREYRYERRYVNAYNLEWVGWQEQVHQILQLLHLGLDETSDIISHRNPGHDEDGESQTDEGESVYGSEADTEATVTDTDIEMLPVIVPPSPERRTQRDGPEKRRVPSIIGGVPMGPPMHEDELEDDTYTEDETTDGNEDEDEADGDYKDEQVDTKSSPVRRSGRSIVTSPQRCSSVVGGFISRRSPPVTRSRTKRGN